MNFISPSHREKYGVIMLVDKSLIPDVLQPQIVFSEPHGSLGVL